MSESVTIPLFIRSSKQGCNVLFLSDKFIDYIQCILCFESLDININKR